MSKLPSNFQDKEQYWEWRQKNNPFKYPSTHEPGFFENSPKRRILFLWIPLLVGTAALGFWHTINETKHGRGLIRIPLDILEDIVKYDSEE